MSWFSRKNKYIAPIRLQRSDSYLTDFNAWKAGTEKMDQLLYLQQRWNDYLLTGKREQGFVVLDTPYSKGLVFTLGKSFPQDRGKFLIDYFRDNLLLENYYLYQSLQQQKEKETIQSHYLKPKTNFLGEKPYPQGFGNIVLEVHSVKGKEKLVKVQANYYNDRNYLPPASFESLVEAIL